MIYELRHYVPNQGRRDQLRERFATGTLALFRKANISVVDFWEAPHTGDIWYLVEWADEAAMKAGWDAFDISNGWIALKDKTEKDGPLTTISSIVLERPAYFQVPAKQR